MEPKVSDIGRVTVLLPRDDMQKLDEYCKENGFKKSTLLAKLLRDHLNMIPPRKPLLSFTESNIKNNFDSDMNA